MGAFELSFALLAVLAVIGVGTYLVLPFGSRSTTLVRAIGGMLVTGGLLVLAQQVGSVLPNTSNSLTFYVLAAVSVGAAIMMIATTNPVVTALWFALVLLSNSGLYLLQGAEFISAATVIIYAGAIIVTFLFVIMLAQPRGSANYDRYSREPMLSCLTGVLLSWTLIGTLHYTATVETAPLAARPQGVSTAAIPGPEQVVVGTDHLPASKVSAATPHVAGLGRALFSEHYVSVELIGVILLVAVVGAIMIVTRDHSARFLNS